MFDVAPLGPHTMCSVESTPGHSLTDTHRQYDVAHIRDNAPSTAFLSAGANVLE